MSLIDIRKKLLSIETVYHERGPAAKVPLKIGVIACVIKNPYAGRYVEDLSGLVKDAREMANEMVVELIAALGGNDIAAQWFNSG